MTSQIEPLVNLAGSDPWIPSGAYNAQHYINYGTLSIKGPFGNFVAGVIDNYGSINSYSGITFKNSGLINNSVTGGTINNNPGSTLYNDDGAIIDNSKNSQGANGFINNGTYTGYGTIKGSWTDHGTVKPGSSAGGMLIDGNYYKKGGLKK